MKKIGLSVAAILYATAGAVSAYAQTQPVEGASEQQAQDEEHGLTDIVVTAQRRNERVQDIPIAISAFSADQMQAQGITNTLQIGQYVPNMTAQVNTGVGSANAYFIRGLGNVESIATFDPPVGTYVDDIYLSRQNANNLSLFDVERVEVLRGPQGTLFGRNTTGGAISVVMRRPEFNETSGYAEIGYGSYNKKMARGSVNLPVTDTLAVKVSGYWQDDDGYVKNVTTGERLNDDDGWGVRLGVRGELGSSARWNGSYSHIVNNAENILNFDCNPANRSQCNGRFVTTGLREGGDFATSPFLPTVVSGRKANYGLGNRTTTDIAISNLEFDIAPATTLSLITGFVATTQQYALDFFDGRSSANISNPYPAVVGNPRGGFVFANDGYSSQFTQELKVTGEFGDGRLKYVAGLFYIDEFNRTDFADLFSLSRTTQLVSADRTVRNTASSVAAYVQADLKLIDAITLTAGVRYTDEVKTVTVSDNRAMCRVAAAPASCMNDANLVATTGVVVPKRLTSRLWTPRVAINIRPADDVLLFASATRGFKSGGWNARSTAPSQFLPFDPEMVWSYEAGLKSELFNRLMRLNVTAFYIDVKDLQTVSGQINPVTGAFSSLTRNFADYRNKGVEAELTLAPARGLNLYANVGFQRDKFLIDRSGPANDIYGIPTIATQQATCLAQLAAGQLAASANTAPPNTPANNAPSCANGIITADGRIATPTRTPDWSLTLGGSYRMPIGQMSLTPSVNASYRTKTETSVSNLTIYTGSSTGITGTQPANTKGGDIIAGSLAPASWLVNAGLTLRGPSDKWSISIDCSNCFDQSFAQSSIGNFTYLNLPRMWSVRSRFEF